MSNAADIGSNRTENGRTAMLTINWRKANTSRRMCIDGSSPYKLYTRLVQGPYRGRKHW